MDNKAKPGNPFKIDWNGRGAVTGAQEEHKDDFLEAWTALVRIGSSEFQDFAPLGDFLALIETQIPKTWDPADPEVAVFLKRLDQFEDLGWAIELKRGASTQ